MARIQSESPSRNRAHEVGSEYDTMSPKLDFQSTIEKYYSIIDPGEEYDELQTEEPGEQGATSSDAATSNDDPIFSDAPEPPPPRPPHEYLALIYCTSEAQSQNETLPEGHSRDCVNN